MFKVCTPILIFKYLFLDILTICLDGLTELI